MKKGYSTDTQLKNFKIEGEGATIVLRDEKCANLFCKIRNGAKGCSKIFFYLYRIGDSQKKITLGKYPDISLDEARRKALEIRAMRAKGEKPTTKTASKITFTTLANEYLAKIKLKLAPRSFKKDSGRINNHLVKYFGERDIHGIDGREYIEHFEKLLEESAKNNNHGRDTYERVFCILKSMLNFAASKKYIERSPLFETKFKDTFAVAKAESKPHRAIIDPAVFGEFLRAIQNDLVLQDTTRNALLFGVQTALRSANVRGLKWSFIDFDEGVINLQVDAMKSRRLFVLPLTKQTRAILERQKKISGGAELVFPSDISTKRQLSENTLNQAIKRLGYGKVSDFHGLRASFSTFANTHFHDHGEPPFIIEMCLDHKVQDKVAASYNRTQQLEAKRRVFEWYSDYLDELAKQE